jgi:hypothetical protein
MTCPDCKRYKESARSWRHKAYELSGHPLPWDRGDTWVGLTDEEIADMHHEIKVKGMGAYKTEDIYRAIEAKLKEKNT